MNILIVTLQFPYPPRSGFATRVYNLARALAARHDVTLLSYVGPSNRDGLAALAAEIPVHAVTYDEVSMPRKRAAQALSMLSPRPYYSRASYSAQMQRAISELCSSGAYDVVQLESSYLCGFRFPPGTRIVLDEHNIEYEVFRRMGEGERSLPRRAFNWVEHARFRRFEQRWWERAEACIVTSEREGAIVRATAPRADVTVVRNGVDLTYFRPEPGHIEDGTVVFNGILTYRPNLDAALYLVDEIWPLIMQAHPGARLTIVGRAAEADARRLRRPGVQLVGEVPDIRPYLRRAAVVAVPVRIGGGTRLKVVEGLALAKPMVSTSLGCEGVAVRDGEHLLIGDDAAAFAAQVLRLFADPARASALGEAGCRLIEREYSWRLAGEALEALYARIDASPVIGEPSVAPPRAPVGPRH